jgi:hypothetical protein
MKKISHRLAIVTITSPLLVPVLALRNALHSSSVAGQPEKRWGHLSIKQCPKPHLQNFSPIYVKTFLQEYSLWPMRDFARAFVSVRVVAPAK